MSLTLAAPVPSAKTGATLHPPWARTGFALPLPAPAFFPSKQGQSRSDPRHPVPLLVLSCLVPGPPVRTEGLSGIQQALNTCCVQGTAPTQEVHTSRGGSGWSDQLTPGQLTTIPGMLLVPRSESRATCLMEGRSGWVLRRGWSWAGGKRGQSISGRAGGVCGNLNLSGSPAGLEGDVGPAFSESSGRG